MDRGTDFTGVALHSCRIEPGLEQLLAYNVRRKSWEAWYKRHPLLALLARPFWYSYDYGNSTWRIILTFVALALVFAAAYTYIPSSVIVNRAAFSEPHLTFVQSLYFSIVTMTTLGFGDVSANPDSILGQMLLSVQVVIGYVLVGALVTRFAVLFTGGGPSAKYYRESD